MKTFLISSSHDIFVDDFESGQGELTSSDEILNELVIADNWRDAVDSYLQGTLNFDLDMSKCEVNEDNQIQTACLVDAQNIQANKGEIERWKLGEMVLYSNTITMTIHEVVKISLT